MIIKAPLNSNRGAAQALRGKRGIIRNTDFCKRTYNPPTHGRPSPPLCRSTTKNIMLSNKLAQENSFRCPIDEADNKIQEVVQTPQGIPVPHALLHHANRLSSRRTWRKSSNLVVDTAERKTMEPSFQRLEIPTQSHRPKRLRTAQQPISNISRASATRPHLSILVFAASRPLFV